MTDLRLDGVAFAYPDGVGALAGIDLAIPAGQSLALIGANGSGKTTLARHLVGLLRPDRGRLLLDGEDVAGWRVAQLAHVVGLCFQHPERQIFGHDTFEEVAYGPRHLGVPDEEVGGRVIDALTAVGLADAVNSHPDDLGESARKLLSIASVLAMETPVLVLDEPTTGLDARGRAVVEALVGQLHAAGRTVIAISHDMRFVAETFERVVLLDAGRVIIDGSPAEVFAEAAWPHLRAAGLEPPAAAVIGARLGLGSTPSEESLVASIDHRRGTSPHRNREAT